MKSKVQSEKDIVSLTGLSGIRAKPAMYAGSSDSEGMWTALREVLDNALDEAFAGRNDTIYLVRDPEGANAFWVIDNGGGIPVGDISINDPISHKKLRISALKAIVSLTHTGGKFGVSDDADGQRGTHGAGLKLTNAVSDAFEVYTYRQGWYHTSYAKGKLVKDVAKCKPPKNPAEDDGSTLKSGTLIYVSLDSTVFDKGSKIKDESILRWFEMSAAFSNDVSFAYYDGNEWKEWTSQGAEAYLNSLVESEKVELVEDGANLSLRGKFWDLAVAFTNYDGNGLQGFANGLPNPEGGTHVTTAYNVISKVLSGYAKRGQSFNPSDFREGMLGAVNMRLTACKFHNQAKTKLVDERGGTPFAEELEPLVIAFFAKRKALAATLCERASTLSGLKQEFQQSKRVLKKLKDAKKRNALPTKLAVSLKCTNEEREVYLVEGDSAGGSAKRARDSNFQEVLPLKGKIPNAFGSKASVAIENEEVLSLLMAIGYDPSQEDPFKNLRAGKIVILTDGDVDGAHIQNLILSTIVRFVPQLISEGRVYCALPYEFMVRYKGKWYFDLTMKELLKQVPAAAHGSVMHLKGLGEIEAEVLAEMAFSPSTRRLIKLEPVDRKGHRRIADLAGKDSSHRKELLGV